MWVTPEGRRGRTLGRRERFPASSRPSPRLDRLEGEAQDGDLRRVSRMQCVSALGPFMAQTSRNLLAEGSGEL